MAVNNASAETLAEDAPSQGVTEEGAAVAVGPILERLAWETSEGRSGWNAQRKVEAPRRGMVPYASHNRKLARMPAGSESSRMRAASIDTGPCGSSALCATA